MTGGGGRRLIQKLLREHREKMERRQRAAAYNEFRLQRKVLDALQRVLMRRDTQEKENIQSVNTSQSS